eukprot:13794131-Alexandrium_andersonii.AAC.1
MVGFSDGRDVLPLPLLEEEPAPSRALCRGARQRAQRRRASVSAANACLESLNWLASGQRGVAPDILGPPSPAQRRVHARVLEAVAMWEPPEDLPSPEEAARALLRGASFYEEADVNIA